MPSIRMVVTLVFALTLGSAAPAAAQAAGPFCLEMTRDDPPVSLRFEIFALPMGSTINGAQFLLSAVANDLPYSGAATLDGPVARFTLVAALPAGGPAALAFSGGVDLQFGVGAGACSAIDSTSMGGVCGTGTPVEYTLLSCTGPEPA